ncbi:AAA family ATPase, partial [Acidobacteria bacterium AH-259-O06]|nr:AAA family ATPase [Acidobacteria bacterium AH-259-O06]
MPVKEDTLALKVSEARQRDVGRGIARIDPGEFGRDGEAWEVGDILQIEGKQKTAVKLMPAYAEDRGKGIIQIDGMIRENAQAGIDEKVGVHKVDYKPASRLTLAPMTISSLRGEKDTRYIGRLIEGLPVTEGDRVRATLFGARPMDFKVLRTVPKDGVVIIQPTTVIRLEGIEKAEKRGLAVTYEDVGGLGKETRRVREMIELPLKYPQVFDRLGIDAPKGVLLHGPPG